MQKKEQGVLLKLEKVPQNALKFEENIVKWCIVGISRICRGDSA